MTPALTKRQFEAIYRFLDLFSPIEGNCGRLCGAACCTCSTKGGSDAQISDLARSTPTGIAAAEPRGDSSVGETTPQSAGDEDVDYSMGLYLLPGEEQMYTFDEDWIHWGYLQAEEYDFPESWTGKVPFFQCTTPPVCPREKRPLQCRTYPLAPHLTVDGDLYMIIHRDPLPYTCPLVDQREAHPLSPAFVKATWTAWRHLIRDPLIFDMVDLDSQIREEEGWPVERVWP